MRHLQLGETRSHKHSEFLSVCLYLSVCLSVCVCVCVCVDAPEQFRYTSQGGQTEIPGTDDVMDLERTRNAFTILGTVCVRNNNNALYLFTFETNSG